MDDVRLQDIKEGQVFWASERGLNARLTALEDAHRDKDNRGWEVHAKDEHGHISSLFTADEAGAYASRYYKTPMYIPLVEYITGRPASDFPECAEIAEILPAASFRKKARP
jgi:hypothetical protein